MCSNLIYFLNLCSFYRYAEGMRIPVKLTRNKVRRGIVQSRYQGIHRGLGQVLVILDSHMEVKNMSFLFTIYVKNMSLLFTICVKNLSLLFTIYV